MNIKEIINKMTLEEKLAQITQLNACLLELEASGDITGPARDLKLKKEDLKNIGSVLNFGGLNEIKKIQENHLKENDIPLLFMLDVVHGDRTVYPIPLGMGATFDPDLMYKCCRMAAKESRAEGIHVAFGPMVDLARDARWGRCMETTGEDPYLNSLMAEAQVKGYQEDLKHSGLISCPKHFAAYGEAEAGRDYNTTDISLRSLMDYYLPSYKACVDAGALMIMTSFNSLNGVPSTANKWLLKDILRDNWNFKGTVISDYNAANELITHGLCADEEECALKVMKAGMDVEMMSTCYIKGIESLIKQGKVSMDEVDVCVERFLNLKEAMGLFEDPYYTPYDNSILMCKEHHELARTAVKKASVLLKNDGILPLSNDVKKICVIGPYGLKGQNGHWACHGREIESSTVYQGFSTFFKGEVTKAMGYKPEVVSTDYSLIPEAVEKAKDADVVILCLGENSYHSGESFSKAKLDLSDAQLKLIEEVNKVNKNIVSIVFSGRPLTFTNMIDNTRALIEAWQPGTEGGNGLAELILGLDNFEGKLPMTFPRSVGQCPIYYNHLRTGRPKPAEDWPWGYVSFYQDELNKPLFPFGYGLSYTTFEISDLKLNKEVMNMEEENYVTCKVKNTGNVKGTETVQFYINDEAASLCRPVKELKGFKKVELEPGEEKVVTFNFNKKTFEFFTIENKFDTEPGYFKLYVGNDSDASNFVRVLVK